MRPGCREACPALSGYSGIVKDMARACTICRHQRRDEIDHALLGGTSQTAIAAEYGLAQASVSRHLHRHLGPTALRAIGRYEKQDEDRIAATLNGTLNQLAFQVVRAQQAAQAARSDGDVALEQSWMNLERAALRELRAAVETQAKVVGVLGDQPVVAIDARRQLAVLGSMSEEELRALAAGGGQLPLGEIAGELVEAVDAA